MADGRLAGKVALITGSALGVGRAGALRFVQEGARLLLAAWEADEGAALAAELNAARPGSALFVQTDSTSPEEVERAVAAAESHFGRLDVAWGNARISGHGSALDTSLEFWNRVLATNLTGGFLLAKYAVPAMARAGGGSLIFIASEFGLVGTRNLVAYCAAMGGVVNMTRAIAVDSAPLKVRVNCICGGAVKSPLLQALIDAAPDPAAFEAEQIRPILLGRIAEPEELAAAALYLASDDSSYVTGTHVTVDGGATTWYGF